MSGLELSAEEVDGFLAEVFPQMAGRFTIERLEPMAARVALKVSEADLRPGGTVSGPTMFTLADCAFYIAVLGMVGRKALTVTTNCSIDFMRKPAATNLVADVRILKLGRLLAVGDVTVFSQGSDAPVAHANITYAIPPKG
ncbi:PaaI family thioesterase [Roseobacter sp. HKCCA0434]|uniref:PaaI family thioesterase n=1 Tax=Roseobacter sp. HKCCA0434 TaxID=3079297 RepID=UPI002905BFF2|nr:PaaI family thioesterase [Roseobacter sp. HKCCA0434]